MMVMQTELFRLMVEASADGLWILDDHGTTVYANARMAELLGRDLANLDGFSAFDALDESGHEDMRRHLADMVGGRPGEDGLETKLVRPDGTELWTLVNWTVLRDEGGERLGWMHRVAEYTDRWELVERLREREQQLATAQSVAMIGSWEWDVATDTSTWTDQLYRIYNVEPQQSTASYENFLEFVHPADRAMVQEVLASTFLGADDFRFDARIVRAGGDQRWVRCLGFVRRAPDGTPVGMGGTTQDITDLVTSDELAGEATRRLEVLQQMAMAANQAKSLDEAIAMAIAILPANTTWSPLCVYAVAEDGTLTGTPLPPRPGFREAEPDPDLARRASVSGVLECRPPSARTEPHGRIAAPVLLAGRAVAIIEMLAGEVPPDESTRVLIGQISGQLSFVAERERNAQDLAEARDDAMEASRLKSEFLATMSHEIRTPMNGVIGLNELLLRTELDDHQRRLAEGLQSAGLSLLGIINDILDLSKIEAGKLELEAADFDVRGVFEQIAGVLTGPAHEKGLELVVACHPHVPLVLRGDPVRFGQVLTNLGSNAVKFTDRGEVVIQAQVARQTAEKVTLRVEVSDTGVGVPAGSRDRLFDAFTQADPSTTRRHGGTGLGLAISRQLVEALGGELGLTSEVGRGSTFTFTAEFERAASTSAPASGSPGLLHGRRVLVVDDHATNRFLLTEQLAAWQMRAVGVASGEAALATLREAADAGQPFEIALLDLVMPGLDGRELARRISADRTLGQPTMLLLSSDQAIGSRAAREVGIQGALSKPVRHSELCDALLGIVASGLDRPEAATTPPRAAAPDLGIRVLVVEDNHVNQLVATGILENLGCATEVAQDGLEAVALLTQPHDYSAVLMDCRMPRLDGFDATRAVRAHESEGQRVPIIAMTASVLEGERERCLAAGMDDFLTKPVDAAALEQVVRRWTAAPTSERLPAPAALASPVPDPVLDPVRRRMLEELTKDGVTFFDRTAASFQRRVGDQVAAIREAIAANDAHRLQFSAHQLKGSAFNLGLPLVGATAARLEALGDAGCTAGATELLAQLVEDVERAVAALAEATAP
jgi:two-component system sensor histidine kinase/response regulator